MKQVSAIVLAAGSGIRLESRIPKPLVKIKSKPLLVYSLNTLSRNPQVKEVIVVANSSNMQGIKNSIKRYKISKVKDVVLGGKERQDSVRQGLKAVDRACEFVLIHDGVRPFIDKDTISAVIRQAEISGAAIAGVPVKATIKQVHSVPFVKKTLNRKNLWEIQTPQVFKKNLILEAFTKFGAAQVTDDASLVEKLGAKVRVVMGSYFNIKVTTPEDLILAQAIACHTG